MNIDTIDKGDAKNFSEINQIHHYPAKMATQLGDYFLSQYSDCVSKGKMLDPFCGSGTSIILSRLYGFDGFGIDILEVPVMVSKAKAQTLTKNQIETLHDLNEGLQCDESGELENWKNREMWFHDDVYRSLVSIRNFINEHKGEPEYPSLFVALSNVVWEVSSADPDIMVPTSSKRVKSKPYYPKEEIVEKFKRNLGKILDLQGFHTENDLSSSDTQILRGDAKQKDTWPDHKFDLILTSPPYGDGIRYRRAVSLQTRFFGLSDEINGERITKNITGRTSFHCKDVSKIQFDPDLLSHQSVTGILSNNPDRIYSLITYLNDIKITLENMREFLVNDGLIGLVIGNPEIADNRVPLHTFIIEIAKDVGLKLYDEPKKDVITDRFQTPVRRSSSEPIQHEFLIPLSK